MLQFYLIFLASFQQKKQYLRLESQLIHLSKGFSYFIQLNIHLRTIYNDFMICYYCVISILIRLAFWHAFNKFNRLLFMKGDKKVKQQKKEKLKVEHKSKSCYGKYQCQYKHKPILTKLNSDSGYPQQILHADDGSPRSNNYIEENKQNLKNFFKERIPPENTLLNKLMKREMEMVNPKRMFQIKQLQYDLKNKTKISLKNSFELDCKPQPPQSFNKVNANFHLNDKNQELKQQYGTSKQISTFYDRHNYRRGTQSHIQKRSKILKKQAYDKVFGPDISAISRTAVMTTQSPSDSPPPRAMSISLASPYKKKNQNHENLKNLIAKMHEYKNKLQDSSQMLQIKTANQVNHECEQNMVSAIQNMTKMYQTRTITYGVHKLQSIQDLGKLSHSYYEQMVNHKSNRLCKRRQIVSQAATVTPPTASLSNSPDTYRIQLDNQSQVSAHDLLMEELEPSPANEDQGGQQKQVVNTARHRFQLLKRTLVKWAALFYIYGIKKIDIFLAFRTDRQPYELEGSYAFFKCIKMGDLKAVRTFLQKDYTYVYQRDFHGKSALSYAAFHNQTAIVNQILSVGVNSDLPCNSLHTSLYYAVWRRNVEMVQSILQKGACPWSTGKNQYGNLIKEGQNAEQLHILFNNARKIYLGMQIQPTISKRKQYWRRNFHRIVQTHQIKFTLPK